MSKQIIFDGIDKVSEIHNKNKVFKDEMEGDITIDFNNEVIEECDILKKRKESEKWSFQINEIENQLHLVSLLKNMDENEVNNSVVLKTMFQQIKRKIGNYKQQDVKKNKYNESEFITFDSIVDEMMNCQLKCRYCKHEMHVLYDISREMKQWTVDRIDNSLGHNKNNFCIACLECNLKRRTRNDEKYRLTKQLVVVKLL